MKIWQMKNQCLQDKGVDCSSHRMRASMWDFEGSLRVLPPGKYRSSNPPIGMISFANPFNEGFKVEGHIPARV